jgi:hypothetical protein
MIYNIIHDIVLKTHREEKTARANTAAIVVEKLAAESTPPELSEPISPTTTQKKHKVQTAGAIYDDGKVYLIGNPLATTKEIRCSKCGLPRLLDIPIAMGAPPDPHIEYCQKRPYQNRRNYDIYGRSLIESTASKAARKHMPANKYFEDAGSSLDSPAPSPPKETTEKQEKLVLPDLLCKNCNKYFFSRKWAAHHFKCLNFGGRASSRAATLKMNGQANGTRNTGTPPLSQRSTPLPPDKKSPVKRDAEEFDEEEDDEEYVSDSPKKKKVKRATAIPKKWRSGKVTVNGKTVEKGVVGKLKGQHGQLKVKDQKKVDKAASQPRELSASSQTLSSP